MPEAPERAMAVEVLMTLVDDHELAVRALTANTA